jgi:hypothetical protein
VGTRGAGTRPVLAIPPRGRAQAAGSGTDRRSSRRTAGGRHRGDPAAAATSGAGVDLDAGGAAAAFRSGHRRGPGRRAGHARGGGGQKPSTADIVEVREVLGVVGRSAIPAPRDGLTPAEVTRGSDVYHRDEQPDPETPLRRGVRFGAVIDDEGTVEPDEP